MPGRPLARDLSVAPFARFGHPGPSVENDLSIGTAPEPAPESALEQVHGLVHGVRRDLRPHQPAVDIQRGLRPRGLG